MFRAHHRAGRVAWSAPTLSAPSQPAHPRLNLGGFRVSFKSVSGSSQPALTFVIGGIIIIRLNPKV